MDASGTRAARAFKRVRFGAWLGSLTITLGFLLGFGGCAPATNDDRDPAARAALDYVHTRITTPVSEYIATPEQILIISKARERAFGLCMIPKGFRETPPKKIADDEDRTFGLWNVANARKYGYGFAPQETVPVPFSNPDWQTAREACLASEAETVRAFSPRQGYDEAASRVAADAWGKASNNPLWLTYRRAWQHCLTRNDLEPSDDEMDIISKQGTDITAREDPINPSPEDKESEIRIAVIEATCNQETSLTQNLADLLSSYEAPLVRKNQTQLNVVKQETADYVKAATAYLSSH